MKTKPLLFLTKDGWIFWTFLHSYDPMCPWKSFTLTLTVMMTKDFSHLSIWHLFFLELHIIVTQKCVSPSIHHSFEKLAVVPSASSSNLSWTNRFYLAFFWVVVTTSFRNQGFGNPWSTQLNCLKRFKEVTWPSSPLSHNEKGRTPHTKKNLTR